MTGATRRGVVMGLGCGALAGCATTENLSSVELSGAAVQGGALIGRTAPGANIRLDGEPVGRASSRGLFVIGFDRDAGPRAALSLHKGAMALDRALAIAPGDFDIQQIDGLAQDQVTPAEPELLTRIAEEARRKAEGFASNIDADHFRDGFIMPVEATRISARFGGQRILNGIPSRPHHGVDIAAPIGAPVRAPAAGVVSFAETGLHYEGGLVLIDHGQGLITAYLHLSSVELIRGQRIGRGRKIGEVGAQGRATGPHLCWRMKWRGRNLDPTRLIGVKAPAI
jgi:murein DD-endopeptidase MepM/ murein hydrolase activator NlpD